MSRHKSNRKQTHRQNNEVEYQSYTLQASACTVKCQVNARGRFRDLDPKAGVRITQLDPDEGLLAKIGGEGGGGVRSAVGLIGTSR